MGNIDCSPCCKEPEEKEIIKKPALTPEDGTQCLICFRQVLKD